MGDSNK
jgi:hypothetical protein